MRINQYLARAGVCSRRDADKLLMQGRVTVGGSVADVGLQVEETGSDDVRVDGTKVLPCGNVVIAFNKPVGVTCSADDPFADEIISDYVKYPLKLGYAGRLDRDSEGLVLLTNDGDLVHELAGDSHEREYEVEVDKRISAQFLEAMSQGVFLDGLGEVTKPCKIWKIASKRFGIILTQGLNRQIRRMCRAMGYNVTELVRVRIENVRLGELATGQWRKLAMQEQAELYNHCGLGLI